eukprot:scaffold1433_cov128-Skeletonema_dohrnii-CCMP3373.AAC.6
MRSTTKKINHLKSLLSLLSITLIISRPLLWSAAQQQPEERRQDDITNSDGHADSQQQAEESTTITAKQKSGNPKRITLLGLDDILQLERSGIVGLGSHNVDNNHNNKRDRLNYKELHNKDTIEDGFYDPFAADPSCFDDRTNDDDEEDGEGTKSTNDNKNVIGVNCWHPPDSTVETEYIQVWEDDDEDGDDDEASNAAGLETLAWGYGGDDPDDSLIEQEDDEDDKDVHDQRNGVEEHQQESGIEQQENLDDNNQECTDADDSDDEAVVDSGDEEESTTLPSSSDNNANAETTKEASEKGKESDASSKKKKGRKSKTILVDKHWGTDDNILKMRDRLRGSTNTNNNNNYNNNRNDDGSNSHKHNNQRPPVFLLPGLASTRLVSWKHKPCPQSPLLSDIKMLDHVWLNMNLLIQMATIDVRCWSECMTLGRYQSDYDDDGGEYSNVTDATTESDGDNDSQNEEETTTTRMHGCKLRPDEGLDSISSLAPGSISSNLLVGGTNTVYAWLIQWLADNLGYDVTSIVALPYDWRLSPDKMESRDGFLTLMRKKIEAAVESNGLPGIMVAHSVRSSCCLLQLF